MENLPGGYVPLHVGGAHAIARADAAEAVHAVLARGTLHGMASAHPERRELQGRGVAYAIPLGDGLRVVVRHNRHGGLLAPLTGDRFLAPTRAPAELRTAVRLATLGVSTPPVVAIARYPAGGPFERADVATEEIADALDLADVLALRPELHAAAALATGRLLASLTEAAVRHADLNIKNVLLAPGEHGLDAYVLDVDRVSFHASGKSHDVSVRNWARFERSARKWRDRRGLDVADAWLGAVRAAARMH